MKSDAHKGKVQKGDYGFLFRKKKAEIIRTAVYFGISLLVFLVGFFTTKTKANYLTIVAVLGCLPASKSAVSMIMYLKAKACSTEDKEAIETVIGTLDGYYDLYFTGYSKNFPTDHLVVTKNAIIAYSADKKITEKEFNEHMSPFNYSREETIDNLQSLYDQADKSDGCIYFSWF